VGGKRCTRCGNPICINDALFLLVLQFIVSFVSCTCENSIIAFFCIMYMWKLNPLCGVDKHCLCCSGFVTLPFCSFLQNFKTYCNLKHVLPSKSLMRKGIGFLNLL